MHRFGGPEVLEQEEIPVPVPGPEDVLIKTEYIGIGKPDYLVREGIYPWIRNAPFPIVPGHECVGVIVDKGADVPEYEIGQRVHAAGVGGSYAEYRKICKHDIVALPDGADPLKATGLMNYSIATGMLTEVCGGTRGRTMYIKGAAGGLGTALVQLAPRCGFQVIASASSAEKVDYLREIGAAHRFNYRERSEKDEIMSFTGGEGADLIMDQVAGKHFYDQFDLLAFAGVVVVYNILGGFPEQEAVKFLTDRFAKCQGIRIYSDHIFDTDPARKHQMRTRAAEYFAQGIANPKIFRVFSFDQAREAHRIQDAGAFVGKMVMKL